MHAVTRTDVIDSYIFTYLDAIKRGRKINYKERLMKKKKLCIDHLIWKRTIEVCFFVFAIRDNPQTSKKIPLTKVV
jgi:hypothetical protein